MKRIILVAFAFLCAILILDACYYDNPPEPAPIDPEDVSFTTHILPILSSSCSVPFCHDGTKKPVLTPDVAYTELVGGGYVNLTFPEESKLFKAIQWQGTPMPPDTKLPEVDRQVILIWIQKGAPND